MRFLCSQLSYVNSLAFAADSRLLYGVGVSGRTPSDDTGILVWEPAAGPDPSGRLLAGEDIGWFAINPAGEWFYFSVGRGILFGNQELCIFSRSNNSVIRMNVDSGLEKFAVHASGEWFLMATHRSYRYGRSISRWKQVPDGPPIKTWETSLPDGGSTFVLACDPHGTRFVLREVQVIAHALPDLPQLSIYDAETGRIQQNVLLPTRTVDQILFSPDGAWLVARSRASLLIWDARDFAHKPLTLEQVRKSHFNAMAFHPSGRYLVAASNDRSVRVFDVETWSVCHQYSWDIGRVRSVAISPDGSLVAAGGDRGKVVVWDFDL